MQRTLYPAATAIALHAALLAALVVRFHGDVSALLCVNPAFVGRPPFQAVRTDQGAGGYDGQFYYVLAQNPWRVQSSIIDCPPYRHERILYPALAWAFSAGGDPYALLWVMPALNLLAVGGLAWLGALTARRHGMNEWWGLVVPFALNAGMPLLRDLTDPVAACAVAGLITAWLLGWRWWALGLWAAAAVFSREQNVLIVGIVMAAALWRRRFPSAGALAGVLAAWAGWMCILRLSYGCWPFLTGNGDNFGVPFTAMFRRWAHLGLNGHLSSAALHLLPMTLLMVQMAATVAFALRKGNRLVSVIGLCGVALAVIGGWAIYEDTWSYARVFNWIPLGVCLNSFHCRRRWPLLALSPTALLPLLTVCWACRH